MIQTIDLPAFFEMFMNHPFSATLFLGFWASVGGSLIKLIRMVVEKDRVAAVHCFIFFGLGVSSINVLDIVTSAPSIDSAAREMMVPTIGGVLLSLFFLYLVRTQGVAAKQ